MSNTQKFQMHGILSVLSWLTTGLLFLGPHLWAQPSPGIFKRISEGPYGISEMNVNDLLQDRDGFLWIATTKALIRFDGLEMKMYRGNPSDPRPCNNGSHDAGERWF